MNCGTGSRGLLLALLLALALVVGGLTSAAAELELIDGDLVPEVAVAADEPFEEEIVIEDIPWEDELTPEEIELSEALAISVGGDVVDYAGNDGTADATEIGTDGKHINFTNLVIYSGPIVENDYSDWFHLEIRDEKFGYDNVQWSSSNSDILQVDEYGRPELFTNCYGPVTVTGTLDGVTYSCEVEVRELRMYEYWEYTGAPESSRWIWDNSFCMAVGQTVPYRLEEWCYDASGNVLSKKDVTNQYPLTAESPDCLAIAAGSVTALKRGTSQEDGTSGVYCDLPNGRQKIRFHIFTETVAYCAGMVNIEQNENVNRLRLSKDSGTPGTFPLDDSMFITDPDWYLTRCKPGELEWRSSDKSILRFIGDVKGSTPDNGYSETWYEALKVGEVEVSVWYKDKKLASTTVNVGEEAVWRSAREKLDGPRYINEKELVIYVGSIVENDSSTQFQLRVHDNYADYVEGVIPDVKWESSNKAIVSVDKEGYLYLNGYGLTTVTGTVDGVAYSCKVEVRELRMYEYWEYTGDPESSRWIWDWSFCMAVGQTVPYRLEEWRYDAKGNVTRKTDVTKKYPLTAEDPKYLKTAAGSVTALKRGTSQEDGTSGVYCDLPNGRQKIRFHIFTETVAYCAGMVNIEQDENVNRLRLSKDSGTPGTFPLDDSMFITDPDWYLTRCKPGELEWRSSDKSILRFNGNVKGSTPDSVYSEAWYDALKTGKVVVSVWHAGKKLASAKVNVGEEAVWCTAREKSDGPRYINAKDLVIYNSSVVEDDSNSQFQLEIHDNYSDYDEGVIPDVKWKSSNKAIVSVDKKGCLSWSGFGSATITGTVDGVAYTCGVEVRDLRMYEYWEYTGAPESSRWIWTNTFCMSVGQTVPYRLEELRYDAKGNVTKKTDVTKKYPLTAENPKYLKTAVGSVTALKGDTSQEHGTSGVYCDLPNGHQKIRFHIFTGTVAYCAGMVEIRQAWNANRMQLSNKSGNSGFFPLDDSMFITDPDWFLTRCKPGELEWRSSDKSILRFNGKVKGSTPDKVYSEAWYDARKAGKVKVSVWYKGKRLASQSINVTREDVQRSKQGIDLARCALSVKDQVYTGKALKPAVKVMLDGRKLKKGTDYTVTYSDNKSIGRATAKLQGKGDFIGEATITFAINPPGTTLSGVTAGKKKLTVKWNKQKAASGYEVQYGLKKDFADGEIAVIRKAGTVSATLSGLLGGKKYYVRVRAFKQVDKELYYSSWSKPKSAKTKK